MEKKEEKTINNDVKRNLNESIIKIRVDLQNTNLKKSGKNKFAGFSYFELADFLPALNKLMYEEGINDRFYIKDNEAILELIKGEEINTYTIPFIMFDTPLNKNGQPSMQDIQYLGALNTYYKRYLYLNAFGITDGDIIDGMDNGNLVKKEEKDYRKELIKYCKDNNIDLKDVATKYGMVGKKLSNDDYYDILSEVEGENENAKVS